MKTIFSHPIEVRFRDCDSLGHVNNAVYFSYLEQARLVYSQQQQFDRAVGDVGADWLDTGTVVERVNFATQQLGDASKPGVQAMIERIASQSERVSSPEGLVEACLDQVGALVVSEDTLSELVEFASIAGDDSLASDSPDEEARQRIVEVLQMVAATQVFQRC